MRAPRYFPHCVVVAREHGDGALVRGADVEGADHAVDARGCDDRVAVLVPVVGERFRGREARSGGLGWAREGGRVKGDC